MKLCTIEGCADKYYARGYCNKHYLRVKKHGSPHEVTFERGATTEESFKLHTVRQGDCIIWTGGRCRSGQYGSMWHQGRTKRAHRVAWELANGPIPHGLVIDHKCHVFLCVNPAHLRLATRKQNRENIEGASKGSSTGILGVFRFKNSRKFVAQVAHNGKTHHLGAFDTAEEAGEAAKAKRLELFTHNDADRKAA